VSFHRGALHVHATRAVAAGDELSIAYVEMYAAGEDRRALLQTKKFFQWCASPSLKTKTGRPVPAPRVLGSTRPQVGRPPQRPSQRPW
jgi:hypothetical protein